MKKKRKEDIGEEIKGIRETGGNGEMDRNTVDS